MCGRVVCALDENILINMANTKTLKNNIRYRQSYNITPSGNIPGVYKNNKEMEVEIMKWGFKNKDDILISNARSDSVPLYQIYKDSKRCVIVVQGYYEWKQCISASEEVTRQPYYIKPKDEDFFLFAGVYKMSIDEHGFDIKECAIITKNSNKEIESIHDRMPVMLTKEMMNSYLEDKLPYEDLFHKVEKENVPLEFYPVGDLVNKLSNQGSDNILHKEEIKYDKNKNWKLTCFFSNKNDENSNKKPSVITTVKKDKINSITFTKQIVNPDCDDVSTQITEMNPRYYQGKRASRVEGNKKENVSKQKIKKNPLTLHYKKNVLEKFLIKK